MRVIAGEFRGRTLAAPPGRGTRPILDRVKVAMFDWLGARMAQPGQLPPFAVLDLFCGGGSLGIEAMSRGAASCVFVESDPAALRCLRSNVETLGLGSRVRILGEPAERAAPRPISDDLFGLVFLDPPYRLSEDVSSNSVLGRILLRLGTSTPLASDVTVCWRHDAKLRVPADLPGGWISMERRAWGTMAITVVTRSPLESSRHEKAS
jgi:16S rRNA (guanine966-N2)-methyltransferase